jgi:hypothetical protein
VIERIKKSLGLTERGVPCITPMSAEEGNEKDKKLYKY